MVTTWIRVGLNDSRVARGIANLSSLRVGKQLGDVGLGSFACYDASRRSEGIVGNLVTEGRILLRWNSICSACKG